MKIFKKSKSAIVTLTLFAAILITGGIIHANNQIPETDSRGCFTNELNNGHCVNNGNTYFCATKTCLQRKNCQKSGSENKEDIVLEN